MMDHVRPDARKYRQANRWATHLQVLEVCNLMEKFAAILDMNWKK
jgi:hypothetical protein